MTLFERILRAPIEAMDVDNAAAFKEGPDTFNLRRIALEAGPDLTSHALVAELGRRGVSSLYLRCTAMLAPPVADRRAMRLLGDPFLASYEWATVRMRALQLHGARCQACGRASHDGIVINVDHIKNRRDHPELALTIDNLQVLCNDCNKGKGNGPGADFRAEPASVGVE